jgi:hypothetical protein
MVFKTLPSSISPSFHHLMLDLGAKQVCNEINFVQLIDINEKEKV